MSSLQLRSESASRIRLRLVGDERLIALVRRGDRAAFEVLYDRHAGSLLSFCVYMLGSHHDAEDALQATFAAAHRSLLADERDVTLRPWLFTIARNACISILRRRRPWVELNGEPALTGDPAHQLEVNEEMRHLLDGLLALPEPQRAALVLAELQGLRQDEIATVLGVRTNQVKAYSYQARSTLIAERGARDADCADIREELATARGPGRLKSRLRRHLRSCPGCRDYRRRLARHHGQLGALLPIAPSLALKARIFQETLGSASLPGAYSGAAAVGGGAAGTAALAGGGLKALVATVAAGVACVGACGVGASLLAESGGPESRTAAVSGPGGPVRTSLIAAAVRADPQGSGRRGAVPASGEISSRNEGGQSLGPKIRRHSAATVGRGSEPGAEHEPAASEAPGSPGAPAGADGGGSSQGIAAVAREAERQQKDRAQQAAGEERKRQREGRKQSAGEKHGLAQEQHLRAKEEHKLQREQEKAEREEHRRQLHGLPPGLRKAQREKEKVEREERKAEREKSGAH
jgi:RNA polymerase sigma factor (sigma-70 family)